MKLGSLYAVSEPQGVKLVSHITKAPTENKGDATLQHTPYTRSGQSHCWCSVIHMLDDILEPKWSLALTLQTRLRPGQPRSARQQANTSASRIPESVYQQRVILLVVLTQACPRVARVMQCRHIDASNCVHALWCAPTSNAGLKRQSQACCNACRGGRGGARSITEVVLGLGPKKWICQVRLRCAC